MSLAEYPLPLEPESTASMDSLSRFADHLVVAVDVFAHLIRADLSAGIKTGVPLNRAAGGRWVTPSPHRKKTLRLESKRKQLERCAEIARVLGTDGDEGQFNDRLKLAKQKL